MEVAHRSVNINYKNAFNDERKNGATVDQQYVFADFVPISQYVSKKPTVEQTDNKKPTDLTAISKMVNEEKLPTIQDPNDIRIELVTESDGEEVLQLLKKFFFKDEPLNTFLDLGECKELEKWSLSCIPENCSFKALNSNGEIIGVFLNGIVRKGDQHNHDPDTGSATCQHSKFKKILTLFEHIDSQFDIYKLYPDIDCYLDGKIWSVDVNYRGCGIAGKLTQRTIDYMHEHNIPMYHVLCSSHFSARVCEKLDFKVVYEIRYEDYVVDGETPLVPAKPHVAAKILVKLIT